MKKIIIIAIVFLCFPIISFGQSYQWGKQFGDVDNDNIIAIEVDDIGNTYLLGQSATYSLDLDPGSGTDIFHNGLPGGYGTICFLVKLDPDGNYLWGKVFNKGKRVTYDCVYDLKIGSDHNIYALMKICEYSSNLTIRNTNVVLVKMDAAGNDLMVKSMGSIDRFDESDMLPFSFDLDNNNNIFITGYFVDSVRLVPGNPAFDLVADHWGNYLIKMDSNGNFLWRTTNDYVAAPFGVVKIGQDGHANILYDIRDGGLHNNQKLIKYDQGTGNIIWQKDFQKLNPLAFHIANNGNYVISSYGYHATPADVDPGLGTRFSTASNLLIWLDPNGDLLDYKEYFTEDVDFRVIQSDEENNYYFASSFYNTVDLDPSANSFFLIHHATQMTEGMIVKFDASRMFENAFKLGRANVLPSPYHLSWGFRFTGIKIKNGSEYYCGEFRGYNDFDPSSSIDPFDAAHDSSSSTDGFVIKLSPCTNATPRGDTNQKFCSSQQPTVANLLPNSSSIKWYTSATGGTPLSNTTPLINGQSYYAARQTGSCPESTTRLEVQAAINQTPTAPIAINQSFCEADLTRISNLLASGQEIKWYESATAATALPATTLLQNNTTYFATQTVLGCESTRTQVAVSLTEVAIPIAAVSQIFCFQENATVNDIAAIGQNLRCYDAATGGNLLPANTLLNDGATYYVAQKTGTCESLRTPVLIKIQNTAAPTGNQTQIFCSLKNPTVADIVISGNDILWYPSATATQPLQNNTLLSDGVFYFASQTVDTCESTGRLSVAITLINTLNVTDYAQSYCDHLNDGYEYVNLESYNAQLIANTFGYGFDFYESEFGAQTELTTDVILNRTNFKLISGQNTIYVRVTSPNGCHDVARLDLSLEQTPVITIPEVVPICTNETVLVDAGPGFDSYSWSDGRTGQTISVDTPGNYNVTVTQNYARVTCSATKDFTVVSSSVARIVDVEITDWTDTENVIKIIPSGTGIYEYSLNGISYQHENVFYGLPSGSYTIYVKDENGCGIVEKEVFLLMYPKFFTPNGDGLNDSWRIPFAESESGIQVQVFDKFGKLLKMFGNGSWDGKVNGQLLPAEDYWFILTLPDGKMHKGHFSLKR